MKVFKIINLDTKEEYYTGNKTEFAKENNLTLRLLDYTQTGERNHHKGYKVIGVKTFIESDDGDIILWKTNKKGYIINDCVSEENVKSCKKISGTDFVVTNEKIDIEIYEKEISALRKRVQKLNDALILNRKNNRLNFRYENWLEETASQLSDLLKYDYPERILRKLDSSNVETAIMQLSDLHFGQKVDISDNLFDMDIARERLKRYFDKAIEEIEKRNIINVHIAFVGDLIHSASMITKPDMKLASEYNEVEATGLGFQALAENIDYLVDKYNVSFSGVVGNESRFSNHLPHTHLDSEASNSMDYMIYFLLKERYKNLKNVSFLNEGNKIESVVNINGKNFALIHGDQVLNHTMLNKSVWSFKGRLSETFGKIDYVLMGHIHETYISNDFARNSSLVGSNSYSIAKGIPFSTPSQNLIIVGEDIKAMGISLK